MTADLCPFSGVVQLFVGKPVHPVGADGRMALSDHLRELRARLLKVALIIVVGLAVSLVFYDQLSRLVYDPYRQAQERCWARTSPRPPPAARAAACCST